MIRIGILGAAQIAPLAMIDPVSKRQDCKIVAIACRSAERGRSFANKYEIPNLETDYRAMIERPDIDLVYNALPPSRHADLSIASLNAGKAVLCEKPFAMNVEEAALMANAAQHTNGILIEAFHYRHHPAFQRLLAKIESGEIGEIQNIRAIFAAPVPYRPGEVRHTLSIGGGTLMDMGCYPVHWARTLLAAEPDVSQAQAIKSQPDIDLTMNAELKFAGGISATIECSMDEKRPFQAELTINGSKGKIHMENPLSPHKGHSIKTSIDGQLSEETVFGEQTYDYQLAHVLDVMRGRADAFLGGDDAVANMRVIDNIYKASGMLPR